MDRWIDAVLIGQGYALDYRVGQRADKEACWWRIVIRNGGLVSNWYWIGRYVKDWHSLGLEYDLHWDANCGVIWVAPSFMVKVMDDRPLPRLVCPLIVLVPLTKWGIVTRVGTWLAFNWVRIDIFVPILAFSGWFTISQECWGIGMRGNVSIVGWSIDGLAVKWQSNGTQLALDRQIGHRLGRDPKLVFCTVGESVVNWHIFLYQFVCIGGL